MTAIILTLVLTTFAMFALLLALGLTIQNYLYETTTDRLAVRAVIGAVLLGCFYTFWVHTNTRADHKDKYGVLQDFSPTARFEVPEFTAIRRFPRITLPDGKVKEETLHFRKQSVGRLAQFREEKTNELFRINSSEYMTSAIEVNLAKDSAVRFEPMLDAEGNYLAPGGRVARFVEVNGRRYLETDAPGTVYAPSTKALVIAIAFNVMNYLIWILAFWPAMRFTLSHATIGAIIFGALMMLMVVPLLFEKNRQPPRIPAAVAPMDVRPVEGK